MCYEFSSWFRKERVKEFDRMREQAQDGKRTPTEATPSEPQRARETAKEPEKMPA